MAYRCECGEAIPLTLFRVSGTEAAAPLIAGGIDAALLIAKAVVLATPRTGDGADDRAARGDARREVEDVAHWEGAHHYSTSQ